MLVIRITVKINERHQARKPYKMPHRLGREVWDKLPAIQPVKNMERMATKINRVNPATENEIDVSVVFAKMETPREKLNKFKRKLAPIPATPPAKMAFHEIVSCIGNPKISLVFIKYTTTELLAECSN